MHDTRIALFIAFVMLAIAAVFGHTSDFGSLVHNSPVAYGLVDGLLFATPAAFVGTYVFPALLRRLHLTA